MAYPTRPFWASLDPGKPEPLDKVLAALHCYQVAAPSNHSSFYFESTVDCKDHHRLVFDSSTGKLATMSAQKALMELKFSIYHVIATGLESISHLSAPIGPLARIMWQGEGPDDNHDHLTVFSTGSTSILVFTTTREHMGLDKCAHYFTQSPTLRTITVVQLALPMQLETDDRQVRRLTEHSHVSVFTKVNGPVRAVVQRESLSTPGGAIKFWVSDLVKQDDDAKCLPDEFTRPLHNEADNRPANITIPYSAIVSKLRQRYEHGIRMAKDTDGRAHMRGGNDFKAGSSGGGGKRPFSTLASGNKSHKTFGYPC